MALKDWKKDKRFSYSWNNKKKNITLMLYTSTGSIYGGKWWLRLLNHNKRIGINNPEDFEGLYSKPIAIKKAKAYMRTH